MYSRIFALFFALSSGLAISACDDDDDIVAEGERCNYGCVGFSCNLSCEGELLFRCTQDERWHLEQDCAAEGLICEVDDPDSEDGAYTCMEPAP